MYALSPDEEKAIACYAIRYALSPDDLMCRVITDDGYINIYASSHYSRDVAENFQWINNHEVKIYNTILDLENDEYYREDYGKYRHNAMPWNIISEE